MELPTPSRFAKAPGPTVRQLWNTLSRLPGGKGLFSKAIGRAAPYTGSIDARVQELRPGYARLTMQDRPRLRNHLSSLHAVALTNLGEVTTGVAMLAGLPDGVRGIPIGLSIQYRKKARGTMTAECHVDPPSVQERQEFEVEGVIRDPQQDETARFRATWLLEPC